MEWTDEGVTTSVRLFAARCIRSSRRHLRQHCEHSQAKAKRDLVKSKMVPTRPAHTVAHGTGRARQRTAKDVQLRMAALLRLAATPYA